jgi:flagellar biosynthesis protein FlhA
MADTPTQAAVTNPAASMGGLGAFMRADIAFAIGMIVVLMFMLVPIPAWLLDIGLSISITFSIMILMTALFIQRPLDFSAFPTILLISTALRLGLNVASTRLILSEGHTGTDAAGHVIQAFGDFMIAGSYIVGGIVFAILVIVNFIVITKGSGRIAEVAARFSLDAMPGKQMAIDSDLSSGLIDEAEAKRRRSELSQESTFYGSMDGAAKFVRGDAIAGLLIVFINVIGGIIIGAVIHDMSVADAAKNYTLLTIGDGLVSQVPALIVSVAAGFLVSKAGVEGSTDQALVDQFGRYPKALYMSGALMVLIALAPGIPKLPFLFLGGVMVGMGYLSSQKILAKEKAAIETATAAKPVTSTEEPIGKALAIDIIRLELGYGLLPLVQGTGTKLTDQIKGLRRQLAEDMGYVLPAVRIQDNLQLPANAYVLRIKDIEAGRGDVRPGMLMVIDPAGQPITLPGESTTEPTFGLPAMWIDERHREEALFRGYTVVDAATVVTTHLTEIVKDNMADLLSYAETQKLLDELPKEYQKLVADVIPAQITIGGLQRILQRLVAERVSIRDLPTILEGVAEAAAFTRHIGSMAEHARARLARQICDAHRGAHGHVPLAPLSPRWEQAFAESLMGDGEDKQLAMAPSVLQEFITAIREGYDKFTTMGENPALLTSPVIRPYVRSVIERFRPQTSVLSQNEIHPKARIKTIGTI